MQMPLQHRQVSAVGNWPARQNRAVDRTWRSLRETTMVEHRSSEVSSTQLTDDDPVYHTLSVHLSRAKLIARLEIDMPWRSFLSPEFRKKFQREAPLWLWHWHRDNTHDTVFIWEINLNYICSLIVSIFLDFLATWHEFLSRARIEPQPVQVRCDTIRDAILTCTRKPT